MTEKNSDDPKLPAPWLLLLAAFGVPAAAASQLTEWALLNPWLALSLLICWWVLVGIGGFILKLWAKREPAVLAWLDERIDRAWLLIFSRSRRRYLSFVADKSLRLRREGLVSLRPWNFRLDEVFVDLRLMPRSEGEAGTGIVPSGKRGAANSRQSLWALLDRGLDEPLRLVILGGPGTGKTTLLDHVALRLATGKGQQIPRRLHGRVPVVIALRSHAPRIVDKPDIALSVVVESELRATVGAGRTAAWLDQQFARGKAIVMIDGLDEVPDPAARKQIVAWVGRQMQALRRCAFIVTSRPGGYRSNPLEAIEFVTEVEPFSAMQIRQFAYQWFFADTWRDESSLYASAVRKPSDREMQQKVRRRAPVRAEEFLGRLRNLPALDDFAGNPLLLRMMAEVHAAGGTLGERRADLYDEMMKIALGRRRQSKDLPLVVGIEQSLAVIQPLALAMLERDRPLLPASDAAKIIAEPLAQVKRGMKPDDFLDSLQHDAGILVEREAGMLAFAHLTYQEYLAARELGPKGARKLLPRLMEPAWRETVLFWSSLYDASALVTALLRDPMTAVDLELALRIETEAKELKPELQDKLQRLVEDGCESPVVGIRTVFATALLARRLAALRPIDEKAAIDDRLITNAEYQLFLDEKRAVGEWYQPDHWLATAFPPGSGRLPVAGVRPEDAQAFCTWLTQRQGGAARFRLPSQADVGLRPVPLPQGMGYWLGGGGIHLDQTPAGFSQFRERVIEGLDWPIVVDPSVIAYLPSGNNNLRWAYQLLIEFQIAPNPVDRIAVSQLELPHPLDRNLTDDVEPRRARESAVRFVRVLACHLIQLNNQGRLRRGCQFVASGLAKHLARELAPEDDHVQTSPEGAFYTSAADSTDATDARPREMHVSSSRQSAYASLAIILGTASSSAAAHVAEQHRSIFRRLLRACITRLSIIFHTGWVLPFRVSMGIAFSRGSSDYNLASLRLGAACAACLLVHDRIFRHTEPHEGIRIVRERLSETEKEG